jgi:hypothetical protein
VSFGAARLNAFKAEALFKNSFIHFSSLFRTTVIKPSGMSHASSRASFQHGTLYPANATDLQNELNEHLSRARQAAPALHSPAAISTQSRPNPTAAELMRARAIIVPYVSSLLHRLCSGI